MEWLREERSAKEKIVQKRDMAVAMKVQKKAVGSTISLNKGKCPGQFVLHILFIYV